MTNNKKPIDPAMKTANAPTAPLNDRNLDRLIRDPRAYAEMRASLDPELRAMLDQKRAEADADWLIFAARR